MASSNPPTCCRSNSSRQDGRIIHRWLCRIHIDADPNALGFYLACGAQQVATPWHPEWNAVAAMFEEALRGEAT